MKIKDLIFHYWEIKVKEVSEFGPVWKIKTKSDQYCFKRWKHGKSHLLFAYHVIDQLWKNGYAGTPYFIPTVGGLPFLEKNKDIFILTKWVGRPLREDSKKEWLLAAKELAKFHLVSEKICLPSQLEKQCFSGKWLTRFPKRIQEMREAFNRFHTPQNIFEEDVAKYASFIIKSAESAWELLKQSGYEAMVNKIYFYPKICHGNIKAKNFTITDDGLVNIIDFDSFRLDLPVQDLSTLFSQALSSTGWSFCFAQTLFETYDQVRPVHQEEIPILKAFLDFPYDVYKIMRKYAKGRKPPEAYLKKWQKIITGFIHQQHFYQRWFSWLEKDFFSGRCS